MFKVLAVVLWIVTLGLGLLDIYASQFISISIFARFFISNAASATSIDVATANTIRITTVLIITLLYLVFLIATSEYHFKHLNQGSSWRMLSITVVIELIIILLATVVGPVTW